MKKILLTTTAAVLMSATFASANTNAGTTHLILIDESVGGTFISYQSDVISDSDTYSWNGTEYPTFFAASIAAATAYTDGEYDQNDIGILADGTNVENAVAEAYKNIIAANAQIAALQETITGLESDIVVYEANSNNLYDDLQAEEDAKDTALIALAAAQTDLAIANTNLATANDAVTAANTQIEAHLVTIGTLQDQLDGEVNLGEIADAAIKQLELDVAAAETAKTAAETALASANTAKDAAIAAETLATTKYNILYSEVYNTEDGLNVQIGELKAQIAVLEESDNAAVAAKVQEIVGLKATITELNAEIVAHEATIAAFDVTSNDAAVIAAATTPLNTQITELEAEVKSKKEMIESLELSQSLAVQEKLDAKQDLIIANNELIKLKASMTDNATEIAALETEIDDLNDAIDVLEGSKDYLGTLVGLANKEIDSLNAQITGLQGQLAEAQEKFAASEVASNAKDNNLKYVTDTLAFYVDGIQDAIDNPAVAPSKDTPLVATTPDHSLFDAVTSFQYQQSATQHRIRLKAGEAGFTEYVTTDLDDTQTLILSLTETVFDQGFEGGYEAGYNDGWQDGYTVGFADGWSSAIDSLLPEN